jgi:formate dehydrogenase major subunit
VEGSEHDLSADIVISAIGQTQDLSFLNEAFSLETIKGRLVADRVAGKTALLGVYAGGDVVTGPSTAIEASPCRKRCPPLAIDASSAGRNDQAPTHIFTSKAKRHMGRILRNLNDAELQKQHPARVPPEERKHTSKGGVFFTEEEARKRARPLSSSAAARRRTTASS